MDSLCVKMENKMQHDNNFLLFSNFRPSCKHPLSFSTLFTLHHPFVQSLSISNIFNNLFNLSHTNLSLSTIFLIHSTTLVAKRVVALSQFSAFQNAFSTTPYFLDSLSCLCNFWISCISRSFTIGK